MEYFVLFLKLNIWADASGDVVSSAKVDYREFSAALCNQPLLKAWQLLKGRSFWDSPVLFSWEAAGLGDGSQSWPFKDWMQALCIQWGILKQEDFSLITLWVWCFRTQRELFNQPRWLFKLFTRFCLSKTLYFLPQLPAALLDFIY